MSLVGSSGARLGKLLRWWLNKPLVWGARNLTDFLDQQFNLRYLADRLIHEQRAIDEFLSEAGQPDLGKKNSHLVSIISPHYGKKLSLVKAYVRSVARQTYQNWELCICVDGADNSGTLEYFNKLAEECPEQYKIIVHEENRGICAATESALSLANGALIVFADTDDLLHKKALATVVAGFRNKVVADMVYTNHDILTPWGYRIDPVYKPDWSPELLLACNYINHLVAVRRTFLETCSHLWNKEVDDAQDWNLLLEVLLNAGRVFHIPIVLYHWRASERSTAVNSKPWAFKAMDKLQADYLAKRYPALYWEPIEQAGPKPIRFVHNTWPDIYLVQIFRSEESEHKRQHARREPIHYPGKLRSIQVVLPDASLVDMAELLDEAIDELDKEDAVLLFECGDLINANFSGPLDAQAAFCIMHEVACVWPFYNEWRGVYTVAEGRLTPRDAQSGFFTAWSANVLTGPMHGLMIKLAIFKQLGGFSSACDARVADSEPIHVLAALLGIWALHQNLRNAAVRTVKCDWRAPDIELGEATPKFDPYL